MAGEPTALEQVGRDHWHIFRMMCRQGDTRPFTDPCCFAEGALHCFHCGLLLSEYDQSTRGPLDPHKAIA